MAAPSEPSQKPAIVIVEDDTALREALTFMFLAEGFAVEACESAEALLDLDLPARGCLLLDERLPGIPGYMALKRLRRHGVDLPAIVMTTDPAPSLRMAVEAAGAGIVEKPLVGDDLIAQVRAALARDETEPG